jgi:hypothetical protein
MANTKKRKKRGAVAEPSTTVVPPANDPVTLDQARALVEARSVSMRSQGQRRSSRRATRRTPTTHVTLASVGAERNRLALKHREEIDNRIREYEAVFAIMERRGIKGLKDTQASRRPVRRAGLRRGRTVSALPPLQILAEGDSWFHYPVPLFGGGVITRLEDKLGVPILNLATAGDEVRFMLGVKQRVLLAEQFQEGGPTGKPWDVLLFSGGGNDIVDNPMTLWIHDFDPVLPPASHIHQPRFDAALQIVRAGYEDLIQIRDVLSPKTHLLFHGYDFAIPDGRGICHHGPWLKPTFDLRKFPMSATRFEVMKAMLKQFAAMLTKLEGAHNNITFINGQGTLPQVTNSWHNELHPSKAGFNTFAELFHAKLKQLFPGRVL